MHHRPECGGPPDDRPYYDALSEATANLVRLRELEAEAEKRERRRDALDNQIMHAAAARADRQEAIRALAARPRVLPSLDQSPSSSHPALDQAPSRERPALEQAHSTELNTTEVRQVVPVRPFRRTPRSPR